MTVHPRSDDFAPRPRRREKLNEIELRYRHWIEPARLSGRRLTADWHKANPLRRHRVRPALHCEFVCPALPSFPEAIVCSYLSNIEPPMIIHLVVGASPDLVNDCRDDQGEAFAAAMFEFAKKARDLQRDEYFAAHFDGSIELLGVAP